MLQPYQQRVVDERHELADKINALTAFTLNEEKWDQVPREEQERMLMQLKVMEMYSQILIWRIQYFQRPNQS